MHKLHLQNTKTFISKHKMLIIGVFLFTIFIIFGSSIISINEQAKQLKEQIYNNVLEYNEVDMDHLCMMTDCTNIYGREETFIFDKFLKGTDFIKPNIIFSLGELSISDNCEILFYSDVLDSYLAKDFSIFFINNIKFLSIIFISFYTIFISSVYRTYFNTMKDIMVNNIGNEAILANKSMVMITENVHHELNTPVEVIENKIEKVNRTINNYLIAENNMFNEYYKDKEVPADILLQHKKIMKLEKDFEFIHIAIEQILSVLSKMKNFKSLRYSNGDKTIYDIIEGAFKIISISNTDFEHHISRDFKNYSMKSSSLKNVDLLNVLINHIKNSLEANATMIKVVSEDLKNDVLKLVIIDNGQGIPDNVIKGVFVPNFSTKQIGDSIRGNGMHLNKHIIQEFGGDIKIKETSPKGTSIEVSFPAKIKEIPNYDIP